MPHDHEYWIRYMEYPKDAPPVTVSTVLWATGPVNAINQVYHNTALSTPVQILELKLLNAKSDN